MNTKLIIKLISFALITSIIFTGCNQRTIEPDDSDKPQPIVQTYGTTATFDMATWNIENFPIQGSSTISYVAQLIRDMDIDLFGIQELDDTDAFYRLLDSLPDYSGNISNLPTNYLKLGIIYKKDIISISNVTQIYTNDNYAFPRPPMTAYVEVKNQGTVVFDFTLFILHLKAFGDQESESRRRDACNKLKIYIDNNLLNSQDPDVILMGDWNDELDDPPNDNVFQVFLNDTANYRFLTYSLIGQASYPGFDSLIDHILITRDAETEYGNGLTKILDIDNQFSKYSTFVSDHRPVLAQFPVLNSKNIY